jgi:hypothetical protein
MDYEFRIKQAEIELAHLRELQQLHRGRMDAQEGHLDALQNIVQQTAANLDVLTIQTGKLEIKIDQLVDALLRGQARNGGHGK